MRTEPPVASAGANRALAVSDRYQRVLNDLRISVIDRCNFRCPYCMPAERFGGAGAFLPRREWLTPAAIESLARAFVALGVRKLRLTGGEPLLRPELPEIIERLAAIAGVEDLALTTNGALLADQAAALRAAGLRRITVSLDAIEPNRFLQMSGGYGDVTGVLAGIEAARAAGFATIKVNAMIQRGRNEDQVLALAEHFRSTQVVLRFIEYMDVGSCNGWRRDQVVSAAEIRAIIDARYPLRALPATVAGEVARRYAYQDGAGEIGFVASISEPFCGDCNRARISADGRLYTCLFAHGGVDLGRWMFDPDRLREQIQTIWRARSDRYSEQRAERERQAQSRVEMFRMGG